MLSKSTTLLAHVPLPTGRLLDGMLLAGMLLAGSLLPGNAAAQARVLTAQDYARAERFVGSNANPLLDHAVPTVTWLDDARFWSLAHATTGHRFRVLAAATPHP